MTFLLPPLGSVTVVQLAQQRVWTISSTSPQRKAQLWWLRWWVYQIFTKGTIVIFRKLLFIASHVQSIWKAVWQAFFLIYNLNIDFLYSLELTPLGVCRSERKTYVHGKSCAQVFISTFINNCPQWKLPRHSLPCKWMSNRGTCTQWNSILREKGTSCWFARFFHETWVNLKCIQ